MTATLWALQALAENDVAESKSIADAFRGRAGISASTDDGGEQQAELGPADFKILVLQLLTRGGASEKTLPSDEDLEETFRVADKDNSGAVDEEEFVALYSLVKSGQVAGLAAMGAGAQKERVERALRQSAMEAFKKREEAEAELRQHRIQERLRVAANTAKEAEEARQEERRRNELAHRVAEAESAAAAAAAERAMVKAEVAARRAKLKADLKAKKEAAEARKTMVAFGATTAAQAEARAKAAKEEAVAAAKTEAQEGAFTRVRAKMAATKDELNRGRGGFPESRGRHSLETEGAFSSAAAGLREAVAARRRSLSRDSRDSGEIPFETAASGDARQMQPGRRSLFRISYEDATADAWADSGGSDNGGCAHGTPKKLTAEEKGLVGSRHGPQGMAVGTTKSSPKPSPRLRPVQSPPKPARLPSSAPTNPRTLGSPLPSAVGTRL